ncbi:MAG: hypothetical protein GXO77_10240 [Calditrichaeota bacterium]|nr:hypothetical protein [Calditrichota bacterium]
MILRVYIKQSCSDREMVVSDIDARVREVGKVTERQSEAYWKMPELTEERWVFTPFMDPDVAFSRLMEILGSNWRSYDDSAVLSEMTDGKFIHHGIRDIFLEVEYIDRGRKAGVLPRFKQNQEVVIAAVKGSLAPYAGRRVKIIGHAFNRGEKTWEYAIEIDNEAEVLTAEERDLKPLRSG